VELLVEAALTGGVVLIAREKRFRLRGHLGAWN
jgi:hypothetical protein